MQDSGLYDLTQTIHLSYFGAERRSTMDEVRKLTGSCDVSNETHSKIEMELFAHRGQEAQTLRALYDYCVGHPDDLVWYTHTKGAFHKFDGHNDYHRQGQDRIVIGKEYKVCLELMKQGASVCGPRWSATPHSHYSGNAWWANCSYVSTLASPDVAFQTNVCPIKDKQSHQGHPIVIIDFSPIGLIEYPKHLCFVEYMMAMGRYHYEHWIASNPAGIFASALKWRKGLTRNLVENLVEMPISPSLHPDLDNFNVWKTDPRSYFIRLTADWMVQILRNSINTKRAEERTIDPAGFLGFWSVSIDDDASFSLLNSTLNRFDERLIEKIGTMHITLDGALQERARALIDASAVAQRHNIKYFDNTADAIGVMHSVCREKNDENAIVFHLVSDSEARPSQDILIVGAGWERCVNMVLRNGSDVCGEAVATIPHVHLPGNYFVSHCDHIQTFLSPVERADNFTKCGDEGNSFRMNYDAPKSEYETLCAPDWCLGVGDYSPDHFMGSNPNSAFSVCPAQESSACRVFGVLDIEGMKALKLEPRIRNQLEHCTILRTAYDYERWMLRRE